MYKISQEQLQQIVNYLASKPYAEVYQLISLLSNLEKYDTNTTDTDTVEG